MNSHQVMLTIAVILGPGAPAQAVPFTYESPAELTSVLDADGDGLIDVVIVDKASGVRQLALQQADGTFMWADPVSTGLDEVTSLAVGDFAASGAAQGFAVASPKWNRVQVWPAGSIVPAAAVPAGIGPNVVVALDAFGNGYSSTDGIDDIIIATEFDDPPGTGLLSGNAWNGSEASGPLFSVGLDAPLSHANRTRFASNEPWMLAAIQSVSGGTQFITRPYSPIDMGPALAGLPAGATWSCGEFDNSGLSEFLFYSPGASVMTSSPVVRDGPGHFNYSYVAGISVDFGSPLSEVIVLPTSTGAQLLIIFGDGSTAGIYDFDGTNPPVPREALSAPPGMKFSLAGALGAGNFLLFHGSNGGLGASTGWQRWNFNGTTHSIAASGTLPPTILPSRRANVLVYASDPNVTPDASLLTILQAGEWSVSAAYLGSALQVASQRTLSGALGLGSTALVDFGGGFVGDFPWVNQSSSDMSVAALLPALGQPAGEVTFSPQAGTYHLATGATLTVLLSVLPDLPIHYRSDTSQPWTLYDPAAAPQISASTTFQAYAGDGYSGVSGITPIYCARYVIASPPDVVVPAFADTNHNGMADAWESAFGITDPFGDADGDGFSNLDEYLAGTDPNDPNSKPVASDLSDVLLVIRNPDSTAPIGTRVDLAWPIGVIGATLEATANLADPALWIPLVDSPELIGAERVYHYPVISGDNARFFRLRRQP